MTTLVINLAGLIIIGLIIWWFVIAKPATKKVKGNKVTVYVRHGVYEPARIEVDDAKNLTLAFIRQDDSPCSEYVIFENLNKSAQLPLNQAHHVNLSIDKPGEYPFTCQMGMYKGKLIVH